MGQIKNFDCRACKNTTTLVSNMMYGALGKMQCKKCGCFYQAVIE